MNDRVTQMRRRTAIAAIDNLCRLFSVRPEIDAGMATKVVSTLRCMAASDGADYRSIQNLAVIFQVNTTKQLTEKIADFLPAAA